MKKILNRRNYLVYMSNHFLLYFSTDLKLNILIVRNHSEITSCFEGKEVFQWNRNLRGSYMTHMLLFEILLEVDAFTYLFDNLFFASLEIT